MKRFILLSLLSIIPHFLYSQVTTTATKSFVTVRWVAPKKTTVKLYRVYRTTIANGAYVLITSTGPQYRFCKDKNVVSGTHYWYYVTDVNNNNVESSPSNVAEVTAK